MKTSQVSVKTAVCAGTMLLLAGCCVPQSVYKDACDDARKDRNALFESEKKIVQLEADAKILRMKLDESETKLTETSEKLKTSVQVQTLFSSENGYRMPESVAQIYLDSLVLPKNPQRSDVKKYILKVRNLSNCNMQNQREAIMSKLEVLLPEYLEDVMEFANYSYFNEAVRPYLEKYDHARIRTMLENAIARNSNSRYILTQAFNAKATAEDRDFIVKNFEKVPELIAAVKRLGFGKDILPVLKKNFDSSPSPFNNLSRDWVQFLIEFTSGDERQAVMKRLWNGIKSYNRGRNDFYAYNDCATFVAPSGYLPALKWVGDNIQFALSNGSPSANQSIRILFELSGKNVDEFPEWWKLNKDKIVWDGEQQKYIVKE